MQYLPIELVTADMMSANTVTQPNGTVVIQAGENLDSHIIHQLSTLGIKHVTVYGNAIPGYGLGYDAKTRSARIPHLFRNFRDDEKMMRAAAFFERHFTNRCSD